MPTGVFPFIGTVGYKAHYSASVFTREYEDNTYRSLVLSTNLMLAVDLSCRGINRTKKNAILAFWKSHIVASTPTLREFYFYNPDEVSAVDLTGVSTTGRYVAVFTSPNLDITRSGKCRYDMTLPIKCLGVI